MTSARDPRLDTFPKLLAHNVRSRGARPAMREKDFGIWQSWSWAEMATEIRRLAAGFAVLGVARGDKIVLVGDNRPQLYWSICAAQMLGAIPVPVYQDAVADEMAYV
ncbi:MAG: AMP-binding protein, partial [Rhodospirillales bacterium]